MSAEELYPEDCPFCKIAETYPSPNSNAAISTSQSRRDLLEAIPEKPDAEKIQPNCFVILQAPEVLAFLDIQPMTLGHVLVTSRRHATKVQDLKGSEGSEIGFWLPHLSNAIARTIGIPDYNIVQNNGLRAAQVVPHVHFHIIPRPASVPSLRNKSWTMFGRGQRGDLEEDEAERLAGKVREELRRIVAEIEVGDGGGRGVKL
ncbi:HIT-like protein [Aulographum hederae CBS 113979]|uniref:HIT-like protein n=1 Tax=Aulographum hederae CBS 113979 TaxID=1176131 RepID=A0A6G1GJV5_9PEZI|nr:HIT-like protein [Aulographum hederae CBS 113979]